MERRDPPADALRLFRFQTGSIKRLYYSFESGVLYIRFRFQTGSIKSQPNWKVKVTLTSFDSKLVRLKERLGLHQPLGDPRFDSKLVRLKARMAKRPMTPIKVSIPNWFD